MSIGSRSKQIKNHAVQSLTALSFVLRLARPQHRLHMALACALADGPDELVLQGPEYLVHIVVVLGAGDLVPVARVLLLHHCLGDGSLLVALAAHDVDDGLGDDLPHLVIIVPDVLKGAYRADIVDQQAGVAASVVGLDDGLVLVLAGRVVVGVPGQLGLHLDAIDAHRDGALIRVGLVLVAAQQLGLARVRLAHYDDFVAGQLLGLVVLAGVHGRL